MPKFVLPTEAELTAEEERLEKAGITPRGRYTAKSNLVQARMLSGFREVRSIAKKGDPKTAVIELCDFMISGITEMAKDSE